MAKWPGRTSIVWCVELTPDGKGSFQSRLDGHHRHLLFLSRSSPATIGGLSPVPMIQLYDYWTPKAAFATWRCMGIQVGLEGQMSVSASYWKWSPSCYVLEI